MSKLNDNRHALMKMPVNSYMWYGKSGMFTLSIVAKKVNPSTGRPLRYSLSERSNHPLFLGLMMRLISLVATSALVMFVLGLDPFSSILGGLGFIGASIIIAQMILSIKVFTPAIARIPIDRSLDGGYSAIEHWGAYRLNSMKRGGEEKLKEYSNSLEHITQLHDPHLISLFLHEGGLGKIDPEWRRDKRRQLFEASARYPIKGNYGSTTPSALESTLHSKKASQFLDNSLAIPIGRQPIRDIIKPTRRTLSPTALYALKATISSSPVNPVALRATSGNQSALGKISCTLNQAVQLDPRLLLLSQLLSHHSFLDVRSQWNLESIQGEILRAATAALAIRNSPLASEEDRDEALGEFSSIVDLVMPQLEHMRESALGSISQELRSSRNFLRDKFGEPGERITL